MPEKGLALPLLGRFEGVLSRGATTRTETVYVVKGQGSVTLLSRQAAEDIGLVEYPDVFRGIGKLKGMKLKLHADPNAKDVVQKQRRISITKWEDQDVIEDAEGNRRNGAVT